MPLKAHPDHENVFVVEHPLILHKLSVLRDRSTSKKKFKELVREITLLMGYEATTDLPLTTKIVETPLESLSARVIAGKKPVVIPILRAGLGMVDSFVDLVPGARVGHIGIFRNEDTLEPQEYYCKIPKHTEERQFFVVDPMLATGGSATAAVTMLKSRGCRKITFVCLVAAPEGVQRLTQTHPDILIFAAAMDRELNDVGYILPGLGDAGDRLFGTK